MSRSGRTFYGRNDQQQSIMQQIQKEQQQQPIMQQIQAHLQQINSELQQQKHSNEQLAQQLQQQQKQFNEQLAQQQKQFTEQLAQQQQQFTEQLAQLQQQFTEQSAQLQQQFTEQLAQLQQNSHQPQNSPQNDNESEYSGRHSEYPPSMQRSNAVAGTICTLVFARIPLNFVNRLDGAARFRYWLLGLGVEMGLGYGFSDQVLNMRVQIRQEHRHLQTDEPAAFVFVRFATHAVAASVQQSLHMQQCIWLQNEDFIPSVNFATRECNN